jgi:glycosyltransferase involved in cell wall biosynthesis
MAIPISVIMANYNGEAYLREAIESVLAQDYSDFEFIVVDDGSTDGSRDIIAEIKDRHPERINAIYFDANRGQGTAFNAGIAAAKGELVSFIDSDDLWFPGKLENVARTFGDPKRVALHQHNLCLIRDGKPTDEPFREILTVGDYFAYTKRKQILPQFVATSGLTFAKRALDKAVPIPEDFRTCADGFLTRVCFCYGRVSADDGFWGGYRVHHANNTFENPSYDMRAYVTNVLIPSLNRYYEDHDIDLRFVDPRKRYEDAFLTLNLRPNDRVLMLRSARSEVVEQVLEALFEVQPELRVDLLVQESFKDDFTGERVEPVVIGEGSMSLKVIGPQALRLIRSRNYRLGLVPYSTRRGAQYENVHALVGKLAPCPFYGLGTDRNAYQITWWRSLWRRFRP